MIVQNGISSHRATAVGRCGVDVTHLHEFLGHEIMIDVIVGLQTGRRFQRSQAETIFGQENGHRVLGERRQIQGRVLAPEPRLVEIIVRGQRPDVCLEGRLGDSARHQL